MILWYFIKIYAISRATSAKQGRNRQAETSDHCTVLPSDVFHCFHKSSTVMCLSSLCRWLCLFVASLYFISSLINYKRENSKLNIYKSLYSRKTRNKTTKISVTFFRYQHISTVQDYICTHRDTESYIDNCF